MTIPNKIKILGLEWEIKRDSNVAREGNCFGSTHTTKQILFLDPDNTLQHDEEVFLHEVMHAIFWQMGLSKDKDFKDHDIQEKIIHTLSSGLHTVLKDNDMLK